jgi:cytochrome c-type biogenesis protein CcmE
MELTPRTAERGPGARRLGEDAVAGAGRTAAVDRSDAGTPGGGDSRASVGGPRRRRRWLPLLVVGATLVALGVVVVRGLSDATVYFLNADEAVDQREDLGERRFRLQGTVTGDVTDRPDGISFDVTYNGVDVPVEHVGDPPQMFRPGIPVVLEGSWDEDGTSFASDRLLIRHDEEYQEKDDYDERIGEAEAEADAVDADAGGTSNDASGSP